MDDWTSGYVADIGYTFGYYPELNPLRVQFALLSNGIVCPKFETACELGYGQGLSINMNAAATSISWFGTDFNAAQAGFARQLAASSGANAELVDQSFEDYCQRPDLPDFDFIGLHGIWTWISDDNRRLIVDFARRKLKVGGVFYISYNTLPGWSAFAPMRHLMNYHGEVSSAKSEDRISRVANALNFTEKLLSLEPHYLKPHWTPTDLTKTHIGHT